MDIMEYIAFLMDEGHDPKRIYRELWQIAENCEYKVIKGITGGVWAKWNGSWVYVGDEWLTENGGRW